MRTVSPRPLPPPRCRLRSPAKGERAAFSSPARRAASASACSTLSRHRRRSRPRRRWAGGLFRRWRSVAPSPVRLPDARLASAPGPVQQHGDDTRRLHARPQLRRGVQLRPGAGPLAVRCPVHCRRSRRRPPGRRSSASFMLRPLPGRSRYTSRPERADLSSATPVDSDARLRRGVAVRGRRARARYRDARDAGRRPEHGPARYGQPDRGQRDGAHPAHDRRAGRRPADRPVDRADAP